MCLFSSLEVSHTGHTFLKNVPAAFAHEIKDQVFGQSFTDYLAKNPNHQKLNLNHFGLQLKSLRIADDENNKKQIPSYKFSSQSSCEIRQLQIITSSSESSRKTTKIVDLVNQIARLLKTQIISCFKLFIELGFQLSLEPEKIVQIGANKCFVKNFIEFTRILKENQETEDENQKKINKIILNSLLYILMLLVCGEKQTPQNVQFKQKLFWSKAFLTNFLGISIYKHPKFSKLYGIIIVHIYKQNPSEDIKKNMVESIIRNLKYCEHEKTELNLSMILNQLKISYKLRQALVRKQNLIVRIWNIYCKNQLKYQSVYALSYFLYLVQEFPGLSNISSYEIGTHFKITENIKNFVLTSRFYEKTLKRFLQWSVFHMNSSDAFHLAIDLISQLYPSTKMLQQNIKNDLIDNQKWVAFLIQITQIFVKSTPNSESILHMIENGLLTCSVSLLATDTQENIFKNKIYQTIEEALVKVKLVAPRMYQSIISTLLPELTQIKQLGYERSSRRNKIFTVLEFDIKNMSLSPMELE